MKLSITGDGKFAGANYRFSIDGVDITNSLLSVSLEMSAEDANVATIRLLPDEVEVDAEALTMLEAQIKEPTCAS